ncbi:MAG: phosphoribosyltransferase family protein [Lutibacter sp.]|uniref:phosphoribosyltransferase family protein n=1 Tax=Lutibacter sp. TaxID=1925666 RepID=UPI00299E5E67|nr:phosphoribosyltransferase family protein [Lutibacter sp.]MDX1828115.1 phosphoribosyltransferase family protein [Lutibacter sp.]
MQQSIILTNEQIQNKTKRIAYQIYEANWNEKEIVVAGIHGNGYIFATNIANIIENISSIKVILVEVLMDKKKPIKPINTDVSEDLYKNKALILVDDVLNSGTTLMYGVKHFLEVPLKRFNTAVLVNRNHKKYPVKADFKGISLSTSMKEHVSIVFEKDKAFAVLD